MLFFTQTLVKESRTLRERSRALCKAAQELQSESAAKIAHSAELIGRGKNLIKEIRNAQTRMEIVPSALFVTIKLPVHLYDPFIELLERSSRAYEILNNAAFQRQMKDGHFERFMEICCKEQEAKMLFDVANRLCPEAASNIGRAFGDH